MISMDAPGAARTSTPARAPPSKPVGRAYQYTLSLEPHQHHWIFALDWPAQWDLPSGVLTSDYMLVQPTLVSRSIDVVATSYSHVEAHEPLSRRDARKHDTQLPPERNPRTLELSRQLRSAHPDDAGYVGRGARYVSTAGLFLHADAAGIGPRLRRRISFRYEARLLRPLCLGLRGPRSRRGYPHARRHRLSRRYVQWLRGLLDRAAKRCACLGRDLGRRTRLAAHRSDLGDRARARRVRLERRGLRERTDWPVAGIGAHPGSPIFGCGSMRCISCGASGSCDSTRRSQEKLLLLLAHPRAGRTETRHGAGGRVRFTALAWLTWQVRRELKPPTKDSLRRAYDRLCAKLAAVGLPRNAHEGAEAYAARIAQLRPDLAAAVTAALPALFAATLRRRAGDARACLGFRFRRARIFVRDVR